MSRYRKVLYLTGLRIEEWRWDSGRQNQTYRVEYDEDVSKEVMAVIRGRRVSNRQVKEQLVEPNQQDSSE